MKMSTNSDRFRVMGPAVESAQKCISRHRILIAPLRFGAGIKGKIADSWRSGTPVVTTPIGAEGMGWQWDVDDNACWGGLVADDADGIANCVNRLMCDDNLWLRCQSKGHQLLKEMFDFETQGRSLEHFLNTCYDDIKHVRDCDIPYNILWTEQLRSAEFKSKFIEEKTHNRRRNHY